MTEGVRVRRPYDSTRRREQAKATRRAILEAARETFIERGYVATTIDAIAVRAGVSSESVYAAFGNKRTLLSGVLDVAIAGDDEPLPILDRAWVAQLRGEPDRTRRIAQLAHAGRAILERRSAIDEVLRGAARVEPEIAILHATAKEERRAGQRELLGIVAGSQGLREGLTLDEAADRMYAVGSPEMWQLLVVERRWTADRFEAWYREAIENLLA